MDGAGIESFVAQFAWVLLGAVLIGIAAARARGPSAVALVVGGPIVEETRPVDLPRL